MALIIFDIDGTLLRTELVTMAAVRETFTTYGLPVPDQTLVYSFFGKSVEEYHAWLAGQCPTAQADEIIAATDLRELACIAGEDRLYPGTREVLRILGEGGHSLAICSNGPEDYVDTFLDSHELRDLFTVVRCRGMGYDGKKQMVREIMAANEGVATLVVGDRHDDVEGAHSNGAFAIGAQYGFGSREEIRHADACASTIDQVPEIVKRLIENLQ